MDKKTPADEVKTLKDIIRYLVETNRMAMELLQEPHPPKSSPGYRGRLLLIRDSVNRARELIQDYKGSEGI